MVAPYPRAAAAQASDAEREMAILIEAITAIRTIRGEMRISPGVTLEALAATGRGACASAAGAWPARGNAGPCRVTLDANATRPPGSALAVVGRTELYVKLAGVVDFAGERVRLDKEVAPRQRADRVPGRRSWGAPDFVERAPAEVVAKERERLDEQRRLKAKLEASLASIDEGHG